MSGLVLSSLAWSEASLGMPGCSGDASPGGVDSTTVLTCAGLGGAAFWAPRTCDPEPSSPVGATAFATPTFSDAAVARSELGVSDVVPSDVDAWGLALSDLAAALGAEALRVSNAGSA